MIAKSLLLLGLLSLASLDQLRAQESARQDSAKTQGKRSGTWSTNSSSGAPMTGTWTAVFDATNGTVSGTWAILDAQGKPTLGGGWSAAKAATQWNGAWRAVITGRGGEYSGTWTTRVDLKPDASLDDLFEKAILAVVSGIWQSGGKSGAWGIRTCCLGRPSRT
jgi:hypothetical protein